jgi:hypothetical protein
MSSRLLGVMGALAVGVSLWACDDNPSPARPSASAPDSVVSTPVPPTLVALQIDAPTSIETGQIIQLTALARSSDQTSRDATTGVTWISSNPAVLDISAAGLARARAVGRASVKATSGSVESAPRSIQVLTVVGETVTLSGIVTDMTGSKRTPAADMMVWFEVDRPELGDPRFVNSTTTDGNGRYTFPKVKPGRFTKVSTVPFSPRQRQCSTRTTVNGNTEVNIDLLPSDGPLPSPTISGQLYYTTSAGRQPLGGQRIYYWISGNSGYVADLSVVTDDNGQYSFCGLPPEQATVLLFCSNDTSFGNVPVLPRGNMTLDIDATLYRGCI